MSRLRLIALVGALCATAASSNAQQETVTFSDASGLAAEAEVFYLNGGRTIAIRLRNLSTGLPAGFGSEDQLLSSISFDMGTPGDNPGDPRIAGGNVRTGALSFSMNFSQSNVGANMAVSGEFGFANSSTNLLPNVVSSKGAGNQAFGGQNLHGAVALDGPEAGLVPSPGPIVMLGGTAAIQDEVVLRLNLAPPVPDLSFLDNGMRIEFGDGSAFLDNNCRQTPQVVVVPDAGGLNANTTLTAANMPIVGSTVFSIEIDDVGGLCNVTPGALAALFVSGGPGNFLYPGLGCTPGAAGEILLDPMLPTFRTGDMLWSGPGNPVQLNMAIPMDPDLCGITFYAQGFFTDLIGASGPYILTNRLDVTIGL